LQKKNIENKLIKKKKKLYDLEELDEKNDSNRQVVNSKKLDLTTLKEILKIVLIVIKIIIVLRELTK
jgi:hypothetical protein